MTKKVLLFTDSNTHCGVGQFNIALLDALLAAGYQAAYFQRREDNDALRRLEQNGVEFYWLDGNPDERPHDFANDRRLPAKLFTSVDPDVVFFSNGHPLLSYGAINTALFLGYPYVICEGIVAPELLADDAEERGVIANHYRSARSVICMSGENATALSSHYGLQAGVVDIISPVPDKVFFEPRDGNIGRRRRAHWNIPDDTVLCLTVAGFKAVKGHDLMLRAMDALKASPLWERLHFLWVGDGPTLDAVQARVPPGKVTILPFDWRVWELYDAADIFLLPSRAEGLPRVIVEAMAKGLAIAATRVSGTPEALGDTGILIPPPDEGEAAAVEALAASIALLAGDEGMRTVMGKAARGRALADYPPGKEIAAHLDVIDRALRR